MTQSNNSFGTQLTCPHSADARMLTSMIQRVHDPVVARIFLSTLDQYPDLQLQFLGAFLKAQETVKRSQMRYAKARDFGIATMRLKNSAVACGLLVARSCIGLVRFLMNEHANSKCRKAFREAHRSPGSNVISLPQPRKATGTDR
ncbi:hypothetical protein [Comamonas terrigena]|uniref:hypothetical protein n=1 Tax=Comamonas terrigena TaxID=32013 RepID=UPI00244D123B|nr:hypothetical protein [Comamonas terrigena]MDH0051302.1 hypothetical protein [Comamonas terrigena]MDH0513750.1 hypothetical protein [Comamonas terrigena]MDH1093297.1 hypothetical protein [Comamonas terrigena]